ncbi:response regulator [Vibrio viridaestus]|uniref:Response regulator n=1 Tax=Vibrio viridaestus TaxID=2487322 RepID=A0A3N9TGM8_9VIBR|nr:response regulator [Vibrio viridaestus]RQW63160.1 response regulator [Vibrio viridaestus]
MLKPSHIASEAAVKAEVLAGKTILIVDDDPIFRRITGGFLSAQGCEICEAENGLEGLRKLKSESPDLVLCDLAMPILNGVEFVEEVSMAYPSLPLIVVSATEQMSEVAKALKYGIKDFLPKPINNFVHLSDAIVNTLEDSDNHIADQRDFSSQWFRVDDGGDLAEEQELHWHLQYLQSNPSAARDLLNALMPDNDSSQGVWHCNYRLLQPAEAMPIVFDYVWSINGQYAFYVVDSEEEENTVATTLMVRALFHDYMRNLKTYSADLKDLAEILEKGLQCSEYTTKASVLIGLADLTYGQLSIMPAGLDCNWSNGSQSLRIEGGRNLGDNCMKNFMTKDLPMKSKTQLAINRIGSSSFVLELSRRDTH